MACPFSDQTAHCCGRETGNSLFHTNWLLRHAAAAAKKNYQWWTFKLMALNDWLLAVEYILDCHRVDGTMYIINTPKTAFFHMNSNFVKWLQMPFRPLHSTTHTDTHFIYSFSFHHHVVRPLLVSKRPVFTTIIYIVASSDIAHFAPWHRGTLLHVDLRHWHKQILHHSFVLRERQRERERKRDRL